jgi:hypothetical protein
METTAHLATRLTNASRRLHWTVHEQFQWPERLEEGTWSMPPELISIYGTPAYEALDEAARRRLSLYELGNFFSLVLQGERPLVQGLVHRFHSKHTAGSVTDYLHHFVDEENKHMVMFGEFCRRYIGKVYPDKKPVATARKHAKGEEDVVFYCKVLVVEELGDYYNVAIQNDERCPAIVRELNRVHHVDESRHLAFGRQFLAELFETYRPQWSEEVLAGFRAWLAEYLKSSWGDYYNPQMYRDAGIEDGYAMRQLAFAHPACAEHRRRVSQKLVTYFLKHGLLAEEPAL